MSRRGFFGKLSALLAIGTTSRRSGSSWPTYNDEASWPHFRGEVVGSGSDVFLFSPVSTPLERSTFSNIEHQVTEESFVAFIETMGSYRGRVCSGTDALSLRLGIRERNRRALEELGVPVRVEDPWVSFRGGRYRVVGGEHGRLPHPVQADQSEAEGAERDGSDGRAVGPLPGG